MHIPERCDVVVIGGGPAGSMAASFLSQKGYEVVLFDKKKHPRYNVGESLIPHFWKYCEMAKVADKIRAEGFVEKTGGTVIWDGVIRQVAFKNFGYSHPALHVERDRFDQILLEHARAQDTQVFEKVCVLNVRLEKDRESGVTYRCAVDTKPEEMSCRFVVDASGQAAVIARQLGLRVIDEGFRFMSIWGYFKDSKYVASDGCAYPFHQLRTVPPTTFVSSVATNGPGPCGWAWHIPLRESTSVGLVLPIDHLKTVSGGETGLEKYFLRKCQEVPYLSSLLDGARYCEGQFHGIRDYSYRPTQVAGSGFFLIGDAAAFIDPIFSVGAVLAMYSAYLAAWAIDNSFKDPARAEHYRKLFSCQLQGRLEVARALALPPYGLGGDASRFARTSIHFETPLEQELMYVVSTLTSRSDNFTEIARKKDGQRITSSKFRTLEEIIF